MITTVTCSQEYRQALNENLNALLTGKRKPLIVKEVNNTLGKLITDVKMEMMQNALTGNRSIIPWYNKNIISLPAHKPKPMLPSSKNGKKKAA